MIPQHVLSTIPILGAFEVPDPQPTLITSLQLGGIALNNPLQGLRVQVWTCTVSGNDVVVFAPLAAPTIIFSRPNISEVSLAFDQNMQPFVAFVEAGVAKFYWFDSLLEDFTFTDLPLGSTSPRCTLDDSRDTQLGTSDIVLSYIRDGNLMMREQRDRYLIEYVLYADLNLDLINPRIHAIGMTDVLRVKFDLRGNFG